MLAANLLVGYIFLKSAKAKWDNPDNFALYLGRSLGTFRLASLSAWLSYGLICAESLLALAFAMSWGAPYRQGLALLLLASFTAFLAWNRRSAGREDECACFEEGSMLNRYPIARNFVLISLVLATVVFDAEQSHSSLTLVQAAIFAIALLLEYVKVPRKKANFPEEAEKHPALFLSYKLKGMENADLLLAEPAQRPVFIVLEAPSWMVEAKRERWPAHRIVPSSPDAPAPADAPYLLIRDAKGFIQRYSEWEGYLRRYFAESRS